MAVPTWDDAGEEKYTEKQAIYEEFALRNGAVLAKRDAWARIAGCMREEAGSVVGSVIV